MKTEQLKLAKLKYPKRSQFLTATGLCKFPMTVTEVRLALHEDRVNEIEDIKESLVREWLNISPKSASINKKHKLYNEYLEKVADMKLRLEELKSLPSDIVNDEGGVLFDASTDRWAVNV